MPELNDELTPLQLEARRIKLETLRLKPEDPETKAAWWEKYESNSERYLDAYEHGRPNWGNLLKGR
jgi:hypothetical protein